MENSLLEHAGDSKSCPLITLEPGNKQKMLVNRNLKTKPNLTKYNCVLKGRNHT